MRPSPISITALVLSAGSAWAEEHAPLPEPVFTETVTDIDGFAPGELEFELNGYEWRPLQGLRAAGWSVEAEGILLPRIGLRGELFSLVQTGRGPVYGFEAAATFKIVQDFRHDWFLQAEAGGRYPADVESYAQPGEATLPATLDLRVGWRRGIWTLRAGAGVEAGGTAAVAPVRLAAAVLWPFARVRYGFFGVELDVDFARRAPAVVALDLVPNLTSLHLPFKLGLGIPWTIDPGAAEPALGVFVRLFVESEREVEYGASR